MAARAYMADVNKIQVNIGWGPQLKVTHVTENQRLAYSAGRICMHTEYGLWTFFFSPCSHRGPLEQHSHILFEHQQRGVGHLEDGYFHI